MLSRYSARAASYSCLALSVAALCRSSSCSRLARAVSLELSVALEAIFCALMSSRALLSALPTSFSESNVTFSTEARRSFRTASSCSMFAVSICASSCPDVTASPLMTYTSSTNPFVAAATERMPPGFI